MCQPHVFPDINHNERSSRPQSGRKPFRMDKVAIMPAMRTDQPPRRPVPTTPLSGLFDSEMAASSTSSRSEARRTYARASSRHTESQQSRSRAVAQQHHRASLSYRRPHRCCAATGRERTAGRLGAVFPRTFKHTLHDRAERGAAAGVDSGRY